MKHLNFTYLFLLQFLLFVCDVQAQRGNHWVSGKYGGLDFNHEPPEIITTGIHGTINHNTMDTSLAGYSSSISNCSGDLLFYTNGHKVWNKKHQIMTNGDLFTGHSYVKTLAVPTQDTNTYFIVSSCYIEGKCPDNVAGLYLSKVLLNVNNGKEGIDTNNKNELIISRDHDGLSSPHHLTAIPHSNNKEWWIITQVQPNIMHTFLLSEDGITDTVVNHGFTLNYAFPASITPSHDGNAIVATRTIPTLHKENLVMFDFNRSTGVVYPNYKTLFNIEEQGSQLSFDAAFAPNDSLIYFTTTSSGDDPYSSIYRVNRYDKEPAKDKELIVSFNENNNHAGFRSITLAPNHKMYISYSGSSSSQSISIINYPNQNKVQDVGYVHNEIAIPLYQSFSALPLSSLSFPVHNINYTYDTESCKDTTHFINTSDTSISNFFWKVREQGDTIPFDTLYERNPSYVFPADGHYVVTLNGEPPLDHPAACPGWVSYRDTLKIALPATSGFVTDTITYRCSEATLHLQDITAHETDSVLFDFGNGQFVDTNVHTYDSSATYYVRQLVKRPGGCTDTTSDSLSITIEPPPVADYTVEQSEDCVPSVIPVASTSKGADSLRWFINGRNAGTAPELSTVIDTPGSHNITLLAYNSQGCADTLSRPDAYTTVARPSPSITYSRDTLCQAQVFDLNADYDNADSVHWYFNGIQLSNKTSLSHTVTDSGHHELMLKGYNSHCIDTALTSIYAPVEPRPAAVFTVSDTGGCAPHTPDFSNLSKHASSYSWLIEGPSTYTDTLHEPSAVLSDSGHYDVTLVAGNNQGCYDTLEKLSYITVIPAAEAGFMPEDEEGCEHVRFHFKDDSEHADSWHWDFGDGSKSEESEPFHIYRNEGTYDIEQIVSNRYCSDTMRRDASVTIVSAPRPSFVLSDSAGCTPFKLDARTTASGDITETFYTTSTGDTVDGEEATFEFLQADTLFIRQHLTGSTGCEPKDSQEVIITGTPTASFLVSDTMYGCGEKTLYFEADNAPGLDHYWHFPDDSTSTSAVAEYKFSENGEGAIKLISRRGICTDTTTEWYDIKLRPEPELYFDAPDTIVCKPGDVTFRNDSRHADQYRWHFGRGSPLDTENPEDVEHRYEESGVYTVSLTGESAEGCHDTLTRAFYIEVTDSVRAGFEYSPEAGCRPLSVAFNNQSGSEYGPLTHVWHFGTGDSSITESPHYIYDETGTGTYEVVLRSDNGVCSDTAMANINVTGNDGDEDAPVLHRATVKDGKVQIEWNRNPDADRYYIKRDIDDSMQYYSETTDTVYVDEYTDPRERIYHYQVTSTDSCGNTSAISRTGRNIRLQGKQQDNDLAVLTWNSYREWSEGVESYEIERRTWDGDFQMIDMVSDTQYLDEHYWKPGSQGHCYRIAANKRGGAAISHSNELCLPYEPALFIPNAFSPNEDHLNDYFTVHGPGIGSIEIQLYNRWGQEVYYSEDMEEGWDGTVNNEPAPPGMYIYSIRARGVNGKEFDKHGNLYLIR